VDARLRFRKCSLAANSAASINHGHCDASKRIVGARRPSDVHGDSQATLGGWSCVSPGPAQFDGTHEIDALAVGHSYTVYTETLNGVVDPSQITNAIDSLC
jgi:hypothetical protein